MNEKKNAVWVATALAFVTGIFAVFQLQQTLTSERPGGRATPAGSLVGDQTFPARLWEDPFSITEARGIRKLEASDLAEQIKRYMDPDGVLVLAVFIEGLPIP